MEAAHRGVLLQLVHLHRGGPGGRVAAEVCRQHPRHPAHVLRAGGPAVHPGRAGQGRGRRAHRRLPSRRLPLRRGQLQDAPPLPDAEADARGHGHRGRARAPGMDLRRRRREGQDAWSTRWSAQVQKLGPLGIPQKFEEWDKEMEHFAAPGAGQGRRRAACACAEHGRNLSQRWRPLMSKPKVAFYWCASCGGCEETVVDLAEDILGRRRGGGHRPLAGGDGLQVQGHRGDAGQVHHRHPPQRRHPLHRAGGNGPPAAPQEPVPDRLRLLRRQRRHSRPGQPVPARADPQVQLRGCARRSVNAGRRPARS